MHLIKGSPAMMGLATIACIAVWVPTQQAVTATRTVIRVDWTQSYEAGYTDSNGAYAGGSEIMHLVPHKGKLYAANGYWMDSRWDNHPYAERQSAQVLRLDAADGSWQVDLDTGASNRLGARYMKGNIIKSLTFTTDSDGNPLSRPRNVLVMAAGDIRSHVSVWVRNDVTGHWDHGVVKSGSIARGVRWVPRDMEIYRDKITGIERIFLVLGNPGIISGVYDASHPSKIHWDANVEFPSSGTFSTRPLGIVEANGSLLFSVGGVVYRRIDGPNPTYTDVLDLGDNVNADVGGIRGLTTISNPNGAGESILFLWARNGRSSIGQIKRLDPDRSGGYTTHNEANLRDLMSAELGTKVGYVLGAHSDMYPVVHPETRETVHIIGFQGALPGSDHLRWKGSRLYAGAMYAVRAADGTYAVHEVNGPYAPGKPALVSPRTFAQSPFGDNLLFVGGHDASGICSDDMAWVFEASLDVVFGMDGDR
jgi:poly(A) polymerase